MQCSALRNEVKLHNDLDIGQVAKRLVPMIQLLMCLSTTGF